MKRSETSPRVVVLSGSIGRGHDSVADACSSALTAADIAASTVDCMELLGGPGQRVGEFLFRHALSHPALFDGLHFSHLRAGSNLAERMESAAARRLVPALGHRLPWDAGGLLLSVFATGAGAASRLTATLPDWNTVVFCTDATAHSLWVQPGVDRYLVCSKAAGGTVLQYDPFANVVELPPPVRNAFFSAPSQPAACELIGLRREVPHVLLLAGGWGLGPLDDGARALAAAGYEVMVVAGQNHKLLTRLRATAAAVNEMAPGAILPLGFTSRLPELMAAADVVVTTPGQTCHEARVVGRPLVILDIVPGHGRENLLLELAKGGALACPPSPSMIVHSVTAALDGALPTPQPWPVASAADWERIFLSAVSDLVKPGSDLTSG
jgi:processive 1,2-diacylglycerol beta-glucosyltransferase